MLTGAGESLMLMMSHNATKENTMLTVYALCFLCAFMTVAGIGYLCVCTALETRRLKRLSRGFTLRKA